MDSIVWSPKVATTLIHIQLTNLHTRAIPFRFLQHQFGDSNDPAVPYPQAPWVPGLRS